MKILIAPLNWGLGHATRCVPIIRDYLIHNHDVVLGGDGDSLLLLQRYFPDLRVIHFPSLDLHYDADAKQRRFYWRAIPILVRSTLADYYRLRQILAIERFDMVISDNRFGLFTRAARCIYITHQLYPMLPKRLRVFLPLVRCLHACIYKRYDEVWVPDYADKIHNLSGLLSHGGKFDSRVKYIGPLSRFKNKECINDGQPAYAVVAILSGLEPQRAIFEKQILERYVDSEECMLLVKGKISGPQTTIHAKNITIVPSINDEELMTIGNAAKKIIARSGYSTIMDLEAMRLLPKAELVATPGQSEQEYLVHHIKGMLKRKNE